MYRVKNTIKAGEVMVKLKPYVKGFFDRSVFLILVKL